MDVITPSIGHRNGILVVASMRAGDPSQLAAITEAVAGKENLAEDARALAEKAVQLAALLPRVRAKQAQRDAAASDSAAAANSKRAAPAPNLVFL